VIWRCSALAAGALALAACGEEKPIPQVDYAAVSEKAQVRAISVIDLAAKLAAGEVVLIDVRNPDEYAASRIAGALDAPLTHFDPAMIPREDRRETIFYCDNGQRSAQAAGRLAQEYGGTVRYLAGGLGAWQDAGRSTTSQTAPAPPRPSEPGPSESSPSESSPSESSPSESSPHNDPA